MRARVLYTEHVLKKLLSLPCFALHFVVLLLVHLAKFSLLAICIDIKL